MGKWGIECLNGEDNSYGLNFWRPYNPGGGGYGNYYLFLADNGNVGIGTNNPQAKLTVNGLLCAKEVRVRLSGAPCWPDYVFAKDYNLLPLNEVEQYINENQRLPNIPSAKEVQENGIELGDMQGKLLLKIEELTLYTIEQQKLIEELQRQVKELQQINHKQ